MKRLLCLAPVLAIGFATWATSSMMMKSKARPERASYSLSDLLRINDHSERLEAEQQSLRAFHKRSRQIEAALWDHQLTLSDAAKQILELAETWYPKLIANLQFMDETSDSHLLFCKWLVSAAQTEARLSPPDSPMQIRARELRAEYLTLTGRAWRN